MPDDPVLDAPSAPLTTRALDAIAAVRAQPARLAVAVASIVALLAGLWWLLRPPSVTAPEQLLPVVTTGGAGSVGGAAVTVAAGGATIPAVASTVVVHVAGAVVHPGVLHLPTGSRVVDAIDAAGGAVFDADVDRINLAALVADGGWIRVPRVGEAAPASPTGPSSGNAGAPSANAPLDLNQATAAELEDLPGIGPATAAAIVAYREEHGPFASVDALGDVSGIGDAKLAQLRELVRV